MNKPVIIPKGRYKGYYSEMAPEDWLIEVIRHPQNWDDFPGFVEYIKGMRPDLVDVARPPVPLKFDKETVMPRAKHKGTRLKDIPATYLLKCWNSPQDWKDMPGLLEYIKNNIFQLSLEAPHVTVKKLPVTVPEKKVENTFICDKRTFVSKREAQTALSKIRSVKSRDRYNGKKPDRAYECPKCSYWHLTSMPYGTFKEINSVKAYDEGSPYRTL